MPLINERATGIAQLVLVILFVILCFAISSALQSEKPKARVQDQTNRSIFVETRVVSPKPHQLMFEVSGVIESPTDIDIVPQISGQIVEVNEQFFRGGHFKKGELLFQIDPRDFALEVERLEAEVLRAETQLSLEEAQHAVASVEWRQANQNKVTPPLAVRQPQLEEAKASLKAAQSQLKKAKLNLERTRLSMPFNGRVLASQAAVGRFASAGQSIATVFDESTLEVRVALNSQQLAWLLESQNDSEAVKVRITTTHLGKTLSYQGGLKRGTAAIDPKTRFAVVSFGFSKSDNALLPGLFASVQVSGPHLEEVTLIPASAIQKGDLIWLVDEQDRLIKLSPDPIYRTDEYLAVKGIGQSITVVISRLNGVEEGMEVSRIKSASQSLTQGQSSQFGKVGG